jgi:hypothetical protein
MFIFLLYIYFFLIFFYFQIIFLICVALHNFFLFYSINLTSVSIFIIIWLNEKNILINKFSKHNRVNVSSCEIKYFNLHLSLNLSKFIFELSFFVIFHLLTHIILDLFDYMYILIFLFSLKKFLTTKTCQKSFMYKIPCVC